MRRQKSESQQAATIKLKAEKKMVRSRHCSKRKKKSIRRINELNKKSEFEGCG